MDNKEYIESLNTELNDLAEKAKKLEDFISRVKNGEEIELKCPLRLLEAQHDAMVMYSQVLTERLAVAKYS